MYKPKAESFFEYNQRLIDSKLPMSFNEALETLRSFSISSEKETIEVAVSLNLNKKQVKKALSNTVLIPHMEKKETNILAIVRKDMIQTAIDAGATVAGSSELINQIKDNPKINFDACVATPDMLPQIRPIRSILGPKGLMPSAKLGTITTDIVSAIEKLKESRVNYKTDKGGIIHIPAGNIDLAPNSIYENLSSIINSIQYLKPQNVKGNFIKKIYLATSNGPSVILNHKEFLTKK